MDIDRFDRQKRGLYKEEYKTYQFLPIKNIIKKDLMEAIRSFWCERWDSNPHGETTRTSNVLVYHSNTLASAKVL